MVTPKYGINWFKAVYCPKCDNENCNKELMILKVCIEVEKLRESMELKGTLVDVSSEINALKSEVEEFKDMNR